MRSLLTIVGVVASVALLSSCGVGYLAVDGTGRTVVTVLRDVSIMLFALYALVGSLIAAALFGGIAWAIDRFGTKAVSGLAWLRQKVHRTEDVTLAGIEKGVVRPVARTAEGVTMAKTLVARFLPHEPVARVQETALRYPAPVMRVFTSLVCQLRHSPSHPERDGVPGG